MYFKTDIECGNIQSLKNDGIGLPTITCIIIQNNLLQFYLLYLMAITKWGDKMKEYYKEQITKLLDNVDDEKFLRYLYILINEMLAKSVAS